MGEFPTQQESAAHSVSGAIGSSLGESQNRRNPRWYLGIDFGSTGLSAALLDRTSHQLHPIYWEATEHSKAPQDKGFAAVSFRIATSAVISEIAPGDSAQQVTVKSVGFRQLAMPAGDFLLENFKLPLKVGIPYQRE
ncbi:MAG: hypothetical protein ACMG55_10905, partial [Microcoleus sp.]